MNEIGNAQSRSLQASSEQFKVEGSHTLKKLGKDGFSGHMEATVTEQGKTCRMFIKREGLSGTESGNDFPGQGQHWGVGIKVENNALKEAMGLPESQVLWAQISRKDLLSPGGHRFTVDEQDLPEVKLTHDGTTWTELSSKDALFGTYAKDLVSGAQKQVNSSRLSIKQPDQDEQALVDTALSTLDNALQQASSRVEAYTSTQSSAKTQVAKLTGSIPSKSVHY